MRAYIDTSVLLRVVLGSPRRLRGWRSLTAPMSSELIRTESMRVIDRERIRRSLRDEDVAHRRGAVVQVLASFQLVGLTRRILDRAAEPMPTQTPLGTLDAIHLSTAMALRRRYPDLAFATHDEELRSAADATGFLMLD